MSLIKRKQVTNTPGTINDGTNALIVTTITGAALGDFVLVTVDNALHDGVFLSARVVSTDTVDIVIHNESGSNRTYSSTLTFTLMLLRLVP